MDSAHLINMSHLLLTWYTSFKYVTHPYKGITDILQDVTFITHPIIAHILYTSHTLHTRENPELYLQRPLLLLPLLPLLKALHQVCRLTHECLGYRLVLMWCIRCMLLIGRGE